MSVLSSGLILLSEESGKTNPYSQIVFVVAAAFVILIFLRYSRKNRNAAAMRAEIEKAEKPERPERYGGPSRAGRPEGQQDPEVAKLYIELNEFARELEGRMDTKIAYLRKLLAEAERVIGELDRSMAGARVAIAAGPADGKGERAPPLERAPEAAPTGKEQPSGPLPDAETPPSPPTTPTLDITVGDPDKTAGTGEAREKILRLAGEGKCKEEIIEEVGLPKGEVELVLRLHGAQKAGGAREERKGPRGSKSAKAKNN
jgi:hypothetical protein